VSDLIAEPIELSEPAPAPAPEPAPAAGLVEQELLVEDISIDGMCGVY
jgi:mycofactocin precursor